MAQNKMVWGVLLIALLAAATGCTATVTTSTPPTSNPTCSQDASVTGCQGNAVGFSCTGGATPEQTNAALFCSDGTVSGSGPTLFCCVQFTAGSTTTCSQDSTVSGCTGGSIGFSCTGSETPDQGDPSLSCSTGTPGNAGSTLYCCQTGTSSTTPSCAQDSTVSGCVGGASGYSCTGGDTPDHSDASLICSDGIAGNAGSTLYCCIQFASASATSCSQDSTVAGCAAGSIGFSCAGGDTPEQGDTSLTCSVGVAGNAGSTLYCCATATTTTADSCMANAALTCVNGASGYSCTGAATPDTSTLVCSEPARNTTGADYCCLPAAPANPTCAQDQGVVCPQAGSYGFTCTSTDTPSTDYPSLTCSTGVAAGTATQYCCR